MKLEPEEASQWVDEFLAKVTDFKDLDLDVALCPSFVVIGNIYQKIKDTEFKLGSQDCFWEDDGSFTGEVSPKVLKSLGCEYAIIGHSERRYYFNESDEQVNLKVKAALRNDLIPIICVGETFEERKEGRKDFVIMQQVQEAIKGLRLLGNDQLIVAYEPVWVIGSGQAVDPDEAEHANQVIRQTLLDNFPLEEVEEKTRIIYGGSVNPGNVQSFYDEPTIDGFLVGTASLEFESFSQIIKLYAKSL